MTLQQLKYMITVAEKGSITEAAKELFISQPSLSGAIKEDVRNRFSDLGVLYLSRANENVLVKVFEEYNLKFYELFTAAPHVFLRKGHPLADREKILLEDLKPYPRLNFVQGAYESSNFAEELFSNEVAEKSIRISDRAAIVNFMIGLDGYTISSGIFPRYLHGDAIISIPLDGDETMRIGYILTKDRELSKLGEIYVEALKQYQKD